MRKGFRSVVFVGLLVSALFVAFQLSADSGKASRSRGPEYRAGEAVVKLKPSTLGTFGSQTRSLVSALARTYSVSARPFQTDKSLLVLEAKSLGTTSAVPMSQLLADIRANAAVQYAEPNYIYKVLGVPEDSNPVPSDPGELPPIAIEGVIPNDPGFTLTWGLLNVGQKDSKGQTGTPGSDIGATKAWTAGTGSRSFVVAVIDTGVDYNHEDLKENIFVNTAEVAGNGVDDDANGFVDDVHGWNFEGKNNDPMDDNRHGTHCSGTIGALGNNNVGVAGVNWAVRILPVKFLSAGGSGSLADAVEGIKYATLMKVNVMSNSWGGGGFSQTMFDAIKEARDKGILFVAAAGNDGNNNDQSPSYPASYQSENVISVAATDNRDRLASWSNFGKASVHLGAPGVNVYSTVPMDKGGYATFSGTSMACPHVAGAAALLWSLNPGLGYGQIKDRLLQTVDPVQGLRRKTASGGRLDVNNAIMNIVPDRQEPDSSLWKAVAQNIESKHPYESSKSESFEISHPTAKFIRLHFSKVATERNYDFIRVKDRTGEVIEDLTGEMEDYTTDYIVGNKVTITLESDNSYEGFGFVLDRYEFID